MAWPIAAARPVSGSSMAMRALPEAVVGEPPCGCVSLGDDGVLG